MKTRRPLLLLFLSLSLSFSSFANNGNPTEETVTATAATPYSLSNIFFNDSENGYLFIDFESISDGLEKINLYRDSKMMMEDDVTDLPTNAIYELNTSIFRTGNYTIELVTSDGVKIFKKLSIE